MTARTLVFLVPLTDHGCTFGFAAGVDAENCPAGGCSDTMSLLSLRASSNSSSKRCALADHVPCLDGTMCSGDQCCPGFHGGGTYPCPSASQTFANCEEPQKRHNCLVALGATDADSSPTCGTSTYDYTTSAGDWTACCDTSSGDNTADQTLADGQDYTGSQYKAFVTSTDSCTKCGLISNQIECCSDGTTGGSCCGGTGVDDSKYGCCPDYNEDAGTPYKYSTSACCPGAGSSGEVYPNSGYQCCGSSVCEIKSGKQSCCS
ncbi:unnamed protein product [Polarella glacialis]|uniref:Uncharacterized protein n=1 Tax=Polarella glacialis TaxID=89957 RepID=A0A813GS16_POLGL|nr:unnamed protein product [Polarella glacialis]